MSCQSYGPVSQVELPPFVAGDTWDGIAQIGPIVFNQAAPPSNLTKVEMHFRRSADDLSVAYQLSSNVVVGAGTINIISASLWTASIPPQALPLPPGVWRWNIHFTAADNTVFTPVGGTLAVIQAI